MSEKEKLNFEQIFSENKDKVYRLCKGFLGDTPEVDDLFQEIFIKVWNGLDKFRGEAQVSTWIYRIASNTALLYKKRSTKNKTAVRSQDDFSQLKIKMEDDSNEAKQAQEKQLNQLLFCISKLEKTNRIIITMLLDDFSYKEIADVTGISVNYVGVRVNRIKTILKKELNQ